MAHDPGRRTRIALVLALAAVHTGAGAPQRATNVSPGEAGRLIEAEGRCSTLDSTATSDGRGDDLVRYRTAEGEARAAPDVQFFCRIPVPSQYQPAEPPEQSLQGGER